MTVLTRVLYKKMYGCFGRRLKKVAVITRWSYYQGARKAGFHCTYTWPHKDTKFLFEFWNIFQHEKRKFVSPSGHEMVFCVNTNETPNNFYNYLFFSAKGAICYAIKETVIFWRVRTSFFLANSHLVFHWCVHNKWSTHLIKVVFLLHKLYICHERLYLW